MKKILIIGHGTMAEGLVSTIKLLVGVQDNIDFINFYTDNIDYDNILDNYFEKLENNETLIICTDIFFGSVAQKALKYMERPNTYLINGINLPTLLELVLLKDIDYYSIKKCIDSGHKELFLFNKKLLKEKKEESFF